MTGRRTEALNACKTVLTESDYDLEAALTAALQELGIRQEVQPHCRRAPDRLGRNRHKSTDVGVNSEADLVARE
jgi:translation elongation factor EF-Ts